MKRQEVRFGIIGFGNIGSMHATNLYTKKIPRATLTAICDIDPAKRQKAAEKYPNAKIFSSAEALIASDYVDAVIIAVPHDLHHSMAIAAFQKGLHVLTEKPAGIRPSDVKHMNDTAKKSNRVFGIMFNQRTNPLFQKARELVQTGELGKTKRLTWIITNWYRTQSYYDSGTWRATWKGEGGGVLTNQSPHNLDIATWIFGMPKRLQAFCKEGHYHTITVEDLAIIHGEYENGATLQFVTTTGEFPGTNRLEIVGDGGKIVIEDGKLKFWKLKTPENEVRFTSKEGMPQIPFDYSEMTCDTPETAHCGIIENFTEAVLDEKPLFAPGYEGINQVTLTTAAYLSAWTAQMVDLPFDDNTYNQLLNEKQKKETAKKAAAPAEDGENMLPRWTVNW